MNSTLTDLLNSYAQSKSDRMIAILFARYCTATADAPLALEAFIEETRDAFKSDFLNSTVFQSSSQEEKDEVNGAIDTLMNNTSALVASKF